MRDEPTGLIEIRLFKVRGSREEFDRISREGTIPMMRRWGIDVLAHGPSRNDEDGYYLVRAFPSETQRVEGAKAFYASNEWLDKYEDAVMGMIEDYHTAVLPATPELTRLLRADGGAPGSDAATAQRAVEVR